MDDFSRRHQNETLMSAVDRAAPERRPGVDRPPAVDVTRRARDRIPVRLADIRQILGVDEQSPAAERVLAEHADQGVRLARRSIRVGVEPLLAGERDAARRSGRGPRLRPPRSDRRCAAASARRRGRRAHAAAGTCRCRSPRTAPGAPCRGSRRRCVTIGVGVGAKRVRRAVDHARDHRCAIETP